MDEDEDPIVDEMDVFLSKELAENLFLFQYPVRPANKPYTNSHYLSARMKPKQRKVEMSIALDTAASCYARSKGEQIALNVDGGETEEDSVFNSELMDKQTLSSTDATPGSSRYAVGIIKEGELHLTPVNSIIQLRPSFNYLDQADTKVRKQSEKDAADGDTSQDEVEKEEEPKTIKVQFVRQESDIAKARREASYAFHKQKLEEEAWVPAYYIDINDPRSPKEKDGLYCSAADNEISQLSMLPKDYLSKLIPESKADESFKAQMPSNVLSITQLQSMPLVNQIKALLTNAKVLRFSQLLHYLPGLSDPSSVLIPLQQVAVLVQGCWVVKSEILYPKDTHSPNTAVPAEMLCRGRDYLMWKFTQSRCVIRKEIASTVKLLSEDVKEILEQMARPKVNQGWEFREEFDQEFVKRHPEIVQRQEMIWGALYQQLSKVLKIPEEKKRSKKKDGVEPMEVISGEERVKIARKRSQSLSHSPTKKSQSKSQSQTEKAKDVKKRLSLEESVKLSKPKDSSLHSNHTAKDGIEIESRRLLNNPDFNALSEELQENLRTFLREHFEENHVTSIFDMRRSFSLKLLELPKGHIFSAGISDRVLEEASLDIGARVLDIPWPSDNAVERKKLFGMTQGADKLDKLRLEIFKLFSEGFRHKKNIILERLKDVGPEELSKAEKDKFIRTMCVVKNHHWYLKGTISPS